MKRLLAGAVAGLFATGLMTVVISLGERLGWLRTPPPTQITTRFTNQAGIDQGPMKARFNVKTLIAHAGFGSIAGVLYVAVKSALPSSAFAAGVIYGGLVWVTAYGGFLPTLRLYPRPEDDRRSRTAVMIVAHIVYGVSLAGTEKRLSWRYSSTSKMPRSKSRQ